MSPALLDCDPHDKVGCEMGLVCGSDNCAKFHTIDATSGFKAHTDCCDGKVQGKLGSYISLGLFVSCVGEFRS